MLAHLLYLVSEVGSSGGFVKHNMYYKMKYRESNTVDKFSGCVVITMEMIMFVGKTTVTITLVPRVSDSN